MSSQLPLWRILVVDDNPADVALLSLALEFAGLNFRLVVLDDGAEAVSYIKRQGKYADTPCPDLVVIDRVLPKHDGLEILTAIHSSEHMRQVPTVLMTSYLSDDPALAALSIDRQIVKPCDLNAFLKIGVALKDILEAKTRRVSKMSAGRAPS